MFISPLHQAYGSNVDDPSDAEVMARLSGQVRHNILYKKIEQFELDDAETRSISLANYTNSHWSFIIMRVIGDAKLTTAALDTDDASAITADIPCYGTSLLPGIFVLSSYNVNTFTIESLADDTVIELVAAIAAEDDDTRLDDNA
jgi:hypothetical protein